MDLEHPERNKSHNEEEDDMEKYKNKSPFYHKEEEERVKYKREKAKDNKKIKMDSNRIGDMLECVRLTTEGVAPIVFQQPGKVQGRSVELRHKHTVLSVLNLHPNLLLYPPSRSGCTTVQEIIHESPIRLSDRILHEHGCITLD